MSREHKLLHKIADLNLRNQNLMGIVATQKAEIARLKEENKNLAGLLRRAANTVQLRHVDIRKKAFDYLEKIGHKSNIFRELKGGE